MTLSTAMAGVERLFLDTAPVVYLVEHRLTMTDALQAAVAMEAGCDAFLTNDVKLKRLPAPRVIVLQDLDP